MSVADRNAFIGTSGDGVFQSTNNGKTWNVVRVGLSDDSVNFVKIYGDLVCIGTDNGGFYISKDKGVSWNKANVGLGNRKLNCMTMCGTGLYVGTDSGIYRSTNDGLEWKAVNTGLTNTDVRSMMVYSTVIYAGTWGGGIFVSRDYGGVWRYIALKERYITDMLLVNLYAYAATTSGIVKSSDLGLSWYEFALPFNSVNCVHYAAGVFLAGTDVGMQRST
ncbi:MAG: WD40/YVTN/BNR-like repeat-containing protein, partial [Candidatus Kapaibacterium sp.]